MSLATLTRCATAAALLAAITPTDARAQAPGVLSGFMRNVLGDIAAAGRLPRLDSTALRNSVRREIRVYTGLGMGIPSKMVRLWQDDRGDHGRFGLFWHSSQVSWSKDAFRAFVDSTLDCRATTSVRTVNVCWLDERPNHESWSSVLAKLDEVGIETIQIPVEPKTGTDRWMIVVEVRTRTSYRAYSFWAPDSTSRDPAERAAAKMAAIVREAFERRLAK